MTLNYRSGIRPSQLRRRRLIRRRRIGHVILAHCVASYLASLCFYVTVLVLFDSKISLGGVLLAPIVLPLGLIGLLLGDPITDGGYRIYFLCAFVYLTLAVFDYLWLERRPRRSAA